MTSKLTIILYNKNNLHILKDGKTYTLEILEYPSKNKKTKCLNYGLIALLSRRLKTIKKEFEDRNNQKLEELQIVSDIECVCYSIDKIQ